MSHVEKALELYGSNFNCAQAVFGAFADDLGFDSDLSEQNMIAALYEVTASSMDNRKFFWDVPGVSLSIRE